MLFPLLILAVAISDSHAQFPRACMTKDVLATKICCPLWNGSRCGVDAGRGNCTLWNKQYLLQNDDRLFWPLNYFNNSCECLDNFSGFNCGRCKSGFHGENCNKSKVVVREEIRELSTKERRTVFSYLNLAKYTISKDYVILVTGDRHNPDTYQFINATIYDVFVWIHYYSMLPIMKNHTFIRITNYAHQGPAFPGWHRRLLLFLEEEIQDMMGDDFFALPYYDWSNDTYCSICNEDFLGSNDLQGNIDESSYFASWGAICSGYFYDDAICRNAGNGYHAENLLRKPGCDPLTSIPTYQDVLDTLNWTTFDTEPFDRTSNHSFRNILEGFKNPQNGEDDDENMHNMFHDYMGGTMSQVPISANDPMFVLHHGYMDKLLEVWIQKNNATPETYPDNQHLGHGPTDCAMPFFPCVTNMDLLQPSTAYGYNYTQMDRYLHPQEQQQVQERHGFSKDSQRDSISKKQNVLYPAREMKPIPDMRPQPEGGEKKGVFLEKRVQARNTTQNYRRAAEDHHWRRR